MSINGFRYFQVYVQEKKSKMISITKFVCSIKKFTTTQSVNKMIVIINGFVNKPIFKKIFSVYLRTYLIIK